MCIMCTWNKFCRSIGFPMVMGFTRTVVNGVNYITCDELQKRMESDFDLPEGTTPKLAILDARRTDEYFMSHMQNATNIHSTLLRTETAKAEMKTKLEGVPMDALIVTYCAVGLRSAWLAKYLAQMGYTNVKVLYHGFYEWANEGRPIFTCYPPNHTTLQHADKDPENDQMPVSGPHKCVGNCYPAKSVLPQHWVASLVLDTPRNAKLPFPRALYGKHILSDSGDEMIEMDDVSEESSTPKPKKGKIERKQSTPKLKREKSVKKEKDKGDKDKKAVKEKSSKKKYQQTPGSIENISTGSPVR